METTSYWHALDRGPLGKSSEFALDPLKLGISHGGQIDEGLKVNIFRGAKAIELAFFGVGKGQRTQAPTPESYGSTEREDMRQLARINEVEISTHAAPDLGPLSGFDGRQFSKEQKELSLHEVKRALEFAADTARGGAVVVHIGSRQGEFPRAIYDLDEGGQFQMHPDEKKRAPIYVVDKDSGQVQTLPRTMKFFEPIPKEGTKKEEEEYERDKNGLIKYKTFTFDEYEQKLREEEKENGKKDINIAEKLVDEFITRQIGVAEGEALRFDSLAQQEKKELELLKKERKFYKDLEEEGNISYAREQLRKELAQKGLLPESGPGKQHDEEQWQEYMRKPELFLDKMIEGREKTYRGHEQIALSQAREVARIKNEKGSLIPIDKYALPEIKDSLARSAIKAYELEKERGLERPLFISPENWSPESYGSHPKEYKRIIEESREQMVDLLTKKQLKDPVTNEERSNPFYQGLSEKEAKKIAEDHIRGTFDIGHLNFWKKYFKGTDEEFKQWIDKEVDQLTKNNIIGNVHLHDNFGYHDEHLSPGEGNVPIEKFVEKLEKSGYTGKYIAEVGGQKEGQFHTAWTGALNVLRSPVYRTQRWSEIEHSYFGEVPRTPGFLVGDLVPSKDWTLWSETPLE